jgi:hypothetical protein
MPSGLFEKHQTLSEGPQMIRMVIETSDLSGTAMKLEDQKG